MTTHKKNLYITLTPELKYRLDELKKEQFLNTPQSEMVRFLIQRGLQAAGTDRGDSPENCSA